MSFEYQSAEAFAQSTIGALTTGLSARRVEGATRYATPSRWVRVRRCGAPRKIPRSRDGPVRADSADRKFGKGSDQSASVRSATAPKRDARSLDPVFAKPAVERAARDTGHFRGAHAVPVAGAQRVEDALALVAVMLRD